MHIAYSAQIFGIPIEESAVGIDRKEDSFVVYVLEELDNSFKEKRLTATHQNEPDLMKGDFINQTFPILQQHSFAGINSAVEDVSFFAPLATHSTSKIACVRDGEGNELWEIHAYALLSSVRSTG